MMMGGGGGNQSQTLLDLINHPDQLRAHIAELHQANTDRNNSADAHRRAKHEAEEATAKLEAAKAVHDAREAQITNLMAEVENLKSQLAMEIAATQKKQQECIQAQQALEIEHINHQQNIVQHNLDVQKNQEDHNQRQQMLQQRLMQVSKKESELNSREANARAREQFLIAAANELTRSR